MLEARKFVRKADIFFATVVCVLAVLIWIFLFFIYSSPGNEVRIFLDGELYGVYPLAEETTVVIETEEGNWFNVLEIRDGVADVTEANCPDALCVKQKGITQSGESIVCLPHKLVISVSGGEEAEYDVFAQ